MLKYLGEIATLYLKLGIIGFGGPAAHIAMMEEEVVERRKWLTREHFLDLVGATNLIPGPNSTEMAIHVGYIRAGWFGLAVAGICFIFPAVLITAGFAWAYVQFGALPQVAPFLYGIKPAVLAVILSAVWRLGKTALKGWQLLFIGLAVMVVSLLGMNEVIALLGGGIIGMLWLRVFDRDKSLNSKQGLITFAYATTSAASKTAKALASTVASISVKTGAMASIGVSL